MQPRQLERCLLLAVLLHIWLVLVFGNATGTAAPGEGVWGSLTVKLLGRSGGEAGAPPGEPSTEWRDNGAPGSGAAPRQGGQVRPAAPEAAETGAAELGRWNPREVPPEAARTEEVSPAPPSTATLSLPEGFKPIERESVDTPQPRSAAQPAAAAELPAAVGRLEARPDAAVAPLPSAAELRPQSRPAELPTLPAQLPAAVSRLDAAPTAARAATLPSPADLRTPAVTAAAAAPSADLPAPVRRLEAPAETGVATALPNAAELRAAPGTAAAQSAPSTALPAAVQRLEAATGQGAAVTPLSRSSELRTATPSTAAATLQAGQDLPAPVRRLESADSAGGVAPLQAAPNARAAAATAGGQSLPELSGALPGEVVAPSGPARGDPNANPYAAPKASAGSPDAGSRLGVDLAVPPSAAASAPRAPLNLSLPRGDIAARRGPGLVDMLPQPPERKSKLEQSIEDAANKDCRNAYAGAGILAVVPLALDTARGKGCKW
ncbi:hypothetical protein ASD88_16585 [Pelomonas sp. Root662]|nr:hypothetical protein ASC81_18065 [Pelomonas sp. Root405]KRA71397.1 hypothetical protein ASD88_16585 [Pelomonas sp. Root662]